MAAALFKLPEPEDKVDEAGEAETDDEPAAVALGIAYVTDMVADKVDDPIILNGQNKIRTQLIRYVYKKFSANVPL